ncbi:lysoplasmalogenase [Hyphococcus luteus]|uniref:Lysoplasmalogenase n=1 Tax=Hyphococcus luteus TaxID=2058213 RepID=A0A2S7K5N9_9PROT|nr:lysoplasmalogenase [Marinicaulis flavus]PQA87820.1 lysoplasmalogenase [Marinicaulis flavus]
MTPTVFIALCALSLALLLLGEYQDNRALKWAAKPAASLFFVLAAISAGAFESAYGLWVLAALILCMAGDVLLIPAGEKTFLAGMGAFGAGHAAYIGAFLSGGAALTPLFLAGAAGMSVFAILSLRWLWPHLGTFRGPVAAYTAIIAVMVATSILASPPGGGAPSALVIAGAAGFAVSDLAVARDQFVASGFVNRIWGLPLYYGAQLLLASSV